MNVLNRCQFCFLLFSIFHSGVDNHRQLSLPVIPRLRVRYQLTHEVRNVGHVGAVWSKETTHKALMQRVKAAFFARLHREGSLDNWLKRIIQERLDIEEAAFPGFKRELLTKNGR